MGKFIFDIQKPIRSKNGTMKLQRFLLRHAEIRFGARDKTKIIEQPVFENANKNYGGKAPFIMNSLKGPQVWAVLSQNASGYWPTTLYELAHETIHLLNPVRGCTNYLEEGVAVAFSIEASKEYTNHPMSPDSKQYLRALELAKSIPGDFNISIQLIREKCGSLATATANEIHTLFPELDIEIAKELCSECKF